MNAPRWAFRMRGQATETLEIDLYDAVGEMFSTSGEETAKHVREALKSSPQAKAIAVRINSAGGEVVDGMAIHSLLRDHPAKVTVHVDALAGSIASVIAMAGDEIVMAENAFMMIHNPWGVAVGDAEDMRHQADKLDMMRDALVDIYVARTGQKREAVLAAVEAETWMTAADALELGYATKVVPLKSKPAKVTAAAAIALASLRNVPPALLAMVRAAAQDSKAAEAEEKTRMSTKIMVALGLPEDATEDAAVEAIKQRGATAKDHGDAHAALLAATGKTSLPAALGALDAWKTKVEIADAHEQASKAAESARKAAADVAAIDAAVDDGRLPPAKRAGVVAGLEKHGSEWLEAHLALLDPVVNMPRAAGKTTAPRKQIAAADPELRAACRAAGMTVEEFQEWGPKADAYFAAQERGDQ